MAYTKRDYSYEYVDSATTKSISGVALAAETLCCKSIRFGMDGTIDFASSGSEDLIAYISDSDGFNPDTGVPTGNILAQDDDSGGSSQFSISDFSVSASGLYYFWWRRYGGYATSDDWGTTISFTPSSSPGGQWRDGLVDLETVQTEYTEGVRVLSYSYVVYKAFFRDSGTAEFYIPSGAGEFLAYVTDYYSGAYDPSTGFISDYLARDASDVDGSFRISLNVTAGPAYYFWIRAATAGDSGVTTIHIVPPSGGGGDTWAVDDSFDGRTFEVGGVVNFSSGVPGSYYVACVPITFDISGTFEVFSTVSDTSYIGFLTSDTSFSTYTGKPTGNIIGSDQSNTYGLDFTAEIRSGRQYYFWFRTYDGSENPRNALVEFSLFDGWEYRTETPSVLYNISESVTNYRSYVSRANGARIRVRFASSGTYTFYTTSAETPLQAYLTGDTLASAYDSGTGVPYDVVASDTVPDSGGNISFSFNASSGINYYIWIKATEPSGSGVFYLNIGVPVRWDYNAESTIDNISSSITWAGQYQVAGATGVKIGLRFTRSFTAELSSSLSGTSLRAYLTAGDNSFDNTTGIPYGAIASTVSGSDNNFDFSHNVSAYSAGDSSTTYYLWVTSSDGTGTGSFYLNVDVTSPTPVTDGGCYIRVANEWVHAKVYVYTSLSGWVPATPYVYSGGAWNRCT